MKYLVETHFGCTATDIVVNHQSYSGEDARYTLSDEDRENFHEALFKELRERFDAGILSIWNILPLLEADSTRFSETCDQCGDSVESNYYSF